MDHVFIDLGLTDTTDEGEITAIAAVRTDGKGNRLSSFCGDTGPSELANDLDDMLSEILSPKFSKEYVVVAAHADTDRRALKRVWRKLDLKRWQGKGAKIEPFQGRGWIDILQLAWPLVYNERLADRSFSTLCAHYGVVNKEPETALGDCDALYRCYWKLMQQYRIALYGEGLAREVGGQGYQFLANLFR